MAETISRKSIVYDILFEVEQGKKSAKQAEDALKGIDKQASKVDDTIKSLGKGFLAAFAAEKVIAFAKEASELADKAKGVRVAFEQLNGVSLAKLREATSNTVNDLTLMQAAVRADKFKIPLEQLAGFFKFASIRAKETGQSVNFLVDSIIDGIGRKSPLILDNLGLSATKLQSEFKKTGDFAKAAGNLINSELSKAGVTIQSTASASDQLSTSMENFQLAIGTLINEGFLDDFKDFLGDVIQLTTDLITGQREYNEELEKTGATIKKFTEEDVKNLITNTNVLIEVRKQEAEQGRQLSEIEIAAIRDRFAAQSEAIINSTKVVEEETGKQSEIVGNSIKALQERIGQISAQLEVTDPESLLFAQLTKQAQLLQIELDAILTQFNNIKISAIEIKQIQEDEKPLLPKGLIDVTELNKQREELLKAKNEGVSTLEALRENSAQLTQDISSIFGTLAQLAQDGSKAQIALSFANILAANAEALANGIKGAMTLPPPANIISAITTVATVTSLFAQVKSIMSQAQGASSNSASAFAEGEVDIHRTGETRGKDSIPAIIMPGESVITTDKTAKYKPFLEAIHNGNLEDLIRVNYVEPALAVKALEGDDSRSIPDYSEKLYRQLLAVGEGNTDRKRSVRILASIDRKLTPKVKRHPH